MPTYNEFGEVVQEDSLWDSLLSSAQVSVSRRIDNELNSDFYPSPDSGKTEGQTVTTASNKTGSTKEAGTGATIINGVPNAAVFGVGALGLGLIIFLAVK